jgi:hypothetical protein
MPLAKATLVPAGLARTRLAETALANLPVSAQIATTFPVYYGGATYYEQMVWIPSFTHPDVAGVTFGGFYAGKYICSQPRAFNAAGGDNPDVADSADPGIVPAISQYSVPGWRYINYWYARKACANIGPGWHLMTSFEWASLALWSQMAGTMPHGNNANTNPPSDATYTSEKALLDLACYARNAGRRANLTGTGPATWNHNHQETGVSDLNGNMWEWTLGLHLRTADEGAAAGMPLVLASLNVTLAGSPYGASTATGLNSLTDSAKAWTGNEFAGCQLMDSAGTRHAVASNTATVLTLSSGLTPAAGVYEILKAIATDIVAGMTSGHRILTLRNADADLKAFALPATADAAGAAKYGTDIFYFDAADPGSAPNSVRSALRGGGWTGGASTGVFALYLNSVPSSVSYSYSFRCAKAV